MKTVSIVVTYNGSPWIEQCLSSLLNSSQPTHIIVIDNASTDDSKQRVKNFPEVELITLDKNVGFGRANNVGLQRAIVLGADSVLLLNQDAWVAPDAIEQLAKIASTHPEIGILSPVHWNGDGSQVDPNFLSNLARDHQTIADSLRHKRVVDVPVTEVTFVPAAIWLLPRATLEKIGAFDPIFFMYCEDNDYSQRVHWHRLKVAVALHASAYHARGVAVSRKTFGQKVKGKAISQSSLLILLLKNPERPLYRRLLSVAYFVVKQSLLALRKGDWVELLGLGKATIQTTPKFGEIYQHRAKTKQIGSHWLEM